MTLSIGEDSEYVNLGDWISYFTYGVFDGDKIEVLPFDEKNT
jgi:UDP-2,3-diacylglucosamine hydrolase